MKLAQFNCDGGLHEKLNKYPFTQLFNKHQSTLIVGKAGQGKTSLILSLFSSNRLLKKVYDCVILFQPFSSRDSIKEGDAIFDVLPDEQLFNELTEETLDQAVDIVDECAGEGLNSVIILDDVSASLKDAGVEKELKKRNIILYKSNDYYNSHWTLPLHTKNINDKIIDILLYSSI